MYASIDVVEKCLLWKFDGILFLSFVLAGFQSCTFLFQFFFIFELKYDIRGYFHGDIRNQCTNINTYEVSEISEACTFRNFEFDILKSTETIIIFALSWSGRKLFNLTL